MGKKVEVFDRHDSRLTTDDFGLSSYRLVAWISLAGILAALGYVGRFAGGEPPDDVLYLWSTFIGALVQYGIMFILILAIAHGFDRRLLAFEPPERRWAAVGRAVVALVVILVATGILSQFLDAGDEQLVNPLHAIRAAGQSVWLDFLRRGLVTNGGLLHRIRHDAILPRPAGLRSFSSLRHLLCHRG